MDEQMDDSDVVLPSAEELDTGGERDDFVLNLYLIPAAESASGRPEVTYHSGVGNIGSPERAWHGRWASVGGYGANVVGASVRAALEGVAQELSALSAGYQGSEFDGNQWRGRWPADDTAMRELETAWEREIAIHRQSYWEASEWFAGVSWTELCDEAGVDPKRALGKAWDAVAREVADAIGPNQSEIVYGTRDYALAQAEDYRAESAT